MRNRRTPILITVLLVAASWLSSLACKASILTGPTTTSWPTSTSFPTDTPYVTWTPYPTWTPRPTYTPLPTFTPSPTVTRTPVSKVVVNEDFESGFPLFYTGPVRNPSGGQVGSYQIKDGAYYLKAFLGANAVVWVRVLNPAVDDFTAEVDLISVKSASDEHFLYGISFRDVEGVGAYYFGVQIGSPGHYCLWYKDQKNNQSQPLSGCTSPQPGAPELCSPGSTCHLRVKAHNDLFELYVNDTLVGVARDKSADSGAVGLSVEAIDKAGTVEIEYDNFRLTQP
jgi:hypothetical protein